MHFDNDETIMNISVGEYRKLIENNMRYNTLSGIILNKNNVDLSSTETHLRFWNQSLLMEVMEVFETERYNILFTFLSDKIKEDIKEN